MLHPVIAISAEKKKQNTSEYEYKKMRMVTRLGLWKKVPFLLTKNQGVVRVDSENDSGDSLIFVSEIDFFKEDLHLIVKKIHRQ